MLPFLINKVKPAWRGLSVVLLMVVAGCSSLPPASDFPHPVSTALAHPETTRLGKTFDAAAQANPGTSGFRIIPTGADGFLLRMQMINAAERSIDLQYFIFHGDATGRLLSGAIINAADRGVHVRILVDDAETTDGDEQLATLEAHPSIEIRIFNPFSYRGHIKFLRATEFFFNFNRLDYRMHNKLLVVDNSVALIGGRNIGDQYFQIDPESQFADDDMFSVGPITHNLSAIFDEFWNNKLSIPVEGLQDVGQTGVKLDVQRSHLQQQRQDLQADGVDYVTRVDSGEPFNSIAAGQLPLVWAHVELVADSPDKKKIESGDMVGRLMHREVFNAVNAVQSELLMISPYLIPGKEGMQMFNDLHARHVQLRILTNSMESSTESLAQSGYMHYRKPLLDAGVDLHELRTQLGNIKGSGQTALISSYGTYSLHGKLFVLDRKRLFIGSMNFDQRSLHLNTEIGLIIDSPVLAQQVAARFEAMVKLQNAYLVTLDPADSKGKELIWQTEENGQAVTLHVEPARTDWQGFKVRFLTLLPVDDEL